ncbi:MAG: ABC transporter permease [Chloracidobacterium sp.]|nr:ABC transporter permease [Chloracidobacterium sp.]
MIIKDVIIQALQALIGHRIRAMMTMTGIAWGIVAVVLLMAYGNGFHNAIMTGFRRAFSNGTVVVWNGQTSMRAGGERAGRRIRMKESDVEVVRQLGLIKYASPEYVQYAPDLRPQTDDLGGARSRARIRRDAVRSRSSDASSTRMTWKNSGG